MPVTDPYRWYDAFELLDRFDDWARDLEERHRAEMVAVSRSSYEGAMQIRSAYEEQLRRLQPLLQTSPPMFVMPDAHRR